MKGKVKAKAKAEQAPPGNVKMWNCHICNKKMPKDLRTQHLETDRHSTTGWFCECCQKAFQRSAKEGHLTRPSCQRWHQSQPQGPQQQTLLTMMVRTAASSQNTVPSPNVVPSQTIAPSQKTVPSISLSLPVPPMPTQFKKRARAVTEFEAREAKRRKMFDDSTGLLPPVLATSSMPRDNGNEDNDFHEIRRPDLPPVADFERSNIHQQYDVLYALIEAWECYVRDKSSLLTTQDVEETHFTRLVKTFLKGCAEQLKKQQEKDQEIEKIRDGINSLITESLRSQEEIANLVSRFGGPLFE